MPEGTEVDIDAFIEERNEMLISGDLDRAEAFFAKHAPNRPVPTRDVLEVSIHKSRTAITNLPLEVRKASKAWLTEHGYHSLDDGDL
jgi:hypothetical protein